jgi:hypothetical protein
MKPSLPLLAAVTLSALACAGQIIETEFGSMAATTLQEFRPDNNFGKEVHFAVGTLQNASSILPPPEFPFPRNRGLIQFDIAGHIPVGATILSAQVVVWVIVQPPADEGMPNMSFDLHRMLVPWVEGEGFAGGGPPVGRPALEGETTWNNRLHGISAWGTPGGMAGVDYSSHSSGSFFAGQPELGNTDCNPCGTPPSMLLAADVQYWLDNPSENHGWLIKAEDEISAWSTKQFMVPESQIDDYPRLAVTYTFETVPEPSTVAFTAIGVLALFPLLRRRAVR